MPALVLRLELMSEFVKVGLVGRLGSEAAYFSLQRLVTFLQARGLETLIDRETANSGTIRGVTTVEKRDLADECDLIIVVGGDGSLLSSAREACRTGVPLLGVNRGRLGFLTDVSPDEIEEKVGAVLDGQYLAEERFLLDCQVMRDGVEIGTGCALNDVVLHPGKYIRMIDFELYIDDEFVYRQRSDGLIISTPTGSTAYALSVGGPIMHPQLDAIAVVPLNPHTLSSRPIVIHGDSEIKVLVGAQRDINPHVTSDGQTHVVTQTGDEVIVRKKPEHLKLIHPTDHDFYKVCRTKLGWASHAGGKHL